MAGPGLAIGVGRLLGAGILTSRQIAAARIAAGLTADDLKSAYAIRKLLEEDTDEPPAETVTVHSTAIRSIGWNPEGIITVEFRERGTYTYDGSYPLFVAFIDAPSKGRFFNEHFRR